jgi:hypothetical protein
MSSNSKPRSQTKTVDDGVSERVVVYSLDLPRDAP